MLGDSAVVGFCSKDFPLVALLLVSRVELESSCFIKKTKKNKADMISILITSHPVRRDVRRDVLTVQLQMFWKYVALTAAST